MSARQITRVLALAPPDVGYRRDGRRLSRLTSAQEIHPTPGRVDTSLPVVTMLPPSGVCRPRNSGHSGIQWENNNIAFPPNKWECQWEPILPSPSVKSIPRPLLSPPHPFPPSPIFSAQIRRYSAIPQGTATARVQYGPGAAARRRCDELLRFAPRFSPQPTSRPVLFFFFFACPCPCLPLLALGPWSCHVPLPGPSHHARSRSGQRWRSKQASHVGKCNDFVNILISFFCCCSSKRYSQRKRDWIPFVHPPPSPNM